MALVHIPFTSAQVDSTHDIIDDCLVSSADDIRTAAIRALHAFARSYLAPQLLSDAAEQQRLSSKGSAMQVECHGPAHMVKLYSQMG